MDWTKTGVTVAAGLWVAGPAGLWWTVTVDLRVAELWMAGLVDLIIDFAVCHSRSLPDWN